MPGKLPSENDAESVRQSVSDLGVASDGEEEEAAVEESEEEEEEEKWVD